MQFTPWHRSRDRERIERETPRASTRAQRQLVLIQQVRQSARHRRGNQSTLLWADFAFGESREARHGRGLFQYCGQHGFWLHRVGERRQMHGFSQSAPAHGVAFLERGAQRPFVDLGGQEQQVERRRQRQRRAALVHARHEARRRPAQVRAGAPDALAPARQQWLVDWHADDLEYGTGRGKEQIGAGEPP